MSPDTPKKNSLEIVTPTLESPSKAPIANPEATPVVSSPVPVKPATPPKPEPTKPASPAAPIKLDTLGSDGKPAELSLFDKPKEKATDDKGIAQNIVKLSLDTSQKKSILGDIPTLDVDIIDRSFIKKKRLNVLYGVFVVLLLFFAVSFGFFYSQLDPEFNLLGANLAQETETTNQEIYRLQTDVNELNALTGQILINRLAFNGNRYNDFLAQITATNITEEQKKTAQQQLPLLKTSLISTITELQKIFKRPSIAQIFRKDQIDPLMIQQEFNLKTKTKINTSAQSFQNNPEQKDELALYRNATQLVGNQALSRAIKSANIENLQGDDEQFAKLITTITNQAKNEFSIVNSLKNERIKWEEVLTNIINSTKQSEEGLIVANEGTYQMQLYESGGTTAILFSSYTIDVKTGRISVSGNLKTPDETTFSTMANLIESFEFSPNFTEVDYRSFSKSGSPEKGFESSFRIEFFIQQKVEKESVSETPNS